MNSTAGHAFELDGIHKESIVHAGSLAAPVALALAEQHGAMVKRFHSGRAAQSGVYSAQLAKLG